VRRLRPG